MSGKVSLYLGDPEYPGAAEPPAYAEVEGSATVGINGPEVLEASLDRVIVRALTPPGESQISNMVFAGGERRIWAVARRSPTSCASGSKPDGRSGCGERCGIASGHPADQPVWRTDAPAARARPTGSLSSSPCSTSCARRCIPRPRTRSGTPSEAWLANGLDGRSAKTMSFCREVLDPLAVLIGSGGYGT